MTRDTHHAVEDGRSTTAGPSAIDPSESPLKAVEREVEGEYPQRVNRPSSEALAAAIDADPVVRAIRNGEDIVGRLRACQVVIAICCAQLRWLELHPETADDLVETGRSISRRVRAVKKLIELDLQQARHASTEQVDLSNPAVKKVLDLLVQEIEGVTHEMISPEIANEVMALFKNKVEAAPDIPWP